MMEIGSSDYTGILAELKALNRTWCMVDGGNDDETNAVGSDQQQVGGDSREMQKTPLTPLEKSQKAISKLPASSGGSIVPCLFSALHKTNKNSKQGDKNKSSTSQTPEHPDNKKISTNEYELRQMEWHVVLILEIWSCASQSGRKTDLLDALSSAILLYRDQQSKSRNTDKKKKKKKRKRDKKDSKAPTILSEHEKERLVLDHFVDLLSRVPFLLPRDVPLSQFLNNNILSSNRLFWERSPRVVSHIYETFEIPNPYFKKKEKSPAAKKDGKKKEDDSAAKKRKSEKLQAIAKSKKRQRLALLTTKRPKYQGSHFHGNRDDLSKLLDKKKQKTAVSKGKSDKSISLTQRKSRRSKTTTTTANTNTNTNKRQRFENVDQTPTVQKRAGHQGKNKGSIRDENKMNSEKVRKSQDRPKRPTPSGGRTNIDALLADPIARDPPNKSAKTDATTRNNVLQGNKNSITEVLPMTPRKSTDTARVIGETPVPEGNFTPVPKSTLRLVVGETPVPSNRYKMVIGETPTYVNTFGSTPTSPFSSPPVLPSPSKLEECKIPSKQTVKLFGLLKRTNSVGMNAPKGLPKKTLKRTSSIDNARAFLRQKTL